MFHGTAPVPSTAFVRVTTRKCGFTDHSRFIDGGLLHESSPVPPTSPTENVARYSRMMGPQQANNSSACAMAAEHPEKIKAPRRVQRTKACCMSQTHSRTYLASAWPVIHGIDVPASLHPHRSRGKSRCPGPSGSCCRWCGKALSWSESGVFLLRYMLPQPIGSKMNIK